MVVVCILSPSGIRCSSRPCASSICPVRRRQPQPLSVVREHPASGGKPRLYVNHRRDVKELRKRPFPPDTVQVTEPELKPDTALKTLGGRTSETKRFSWILWNQRQPHLGPLDHRNSQALSQVCAYWSWISAWSSSLKSGDHKGGMMKHAITLIRHICLQIYTYTDHIWHCSKQTPV